MSKSMWCDALTTKPITSNDYNSVEVLFWEIGADKPYWGWYDSRAQVWIHKNQSHKYYTMPSEVHHFAYIDNPYT
jgi:hypothetical protein